MAGIEVTHKQENRLCIVGNEYAYFHTWEQFSQPIFEVSMSIGGAPTGVFSRVYGIVEFSDGVRRVEASDIYFCDNDNKALIDLNKMKREVK